MSIRIRIYPQYGLGFGTGVRGPLNDEIVRARRQRARLAHQQSMLERQRAILLQQRLRLDSLRTSDSSQCAIPGPGPGWAGGIGAPYAMPYRVPSYVPYGVPGNPFGGFGFPFTPSFGGSFVNPIAPLLGSALLGTRIYT